VDLRQGVVTLDGETVRLNRDEYRLLALLVEHVGVVLTRPILLMQIWGYAPEIREGRIDTCIRGLRQKLGVYADQNIETVYGTGYRFRPLPEP
jgi:DNA-binding response OmpR family regulator